MDNQLLPTTEGVTFWIYCSKFGGFLSQVAGVTTTMATFVPPLFFKPSAVKNEQLSVLTIVRAALTDDIKPQDIDGVQIIRGMWRIYASSFDARHRLLLQGLNFGDLHVQLQESGNTSAKESASVEKIIIKGVPLNEDNQVILDTLACYDQVEIVSKVYYCYERSSDDLLCAKNGDRYVFVKSPVVPILPRTLSHSIHEITCVHTKQVCLVCKDTDHQPGTQACPAFDPEASHITLRGQDTILSNYCQCSEGCKVQYKNHSFHTGVQAFQFERLNCNGYRKLAKQICETDSVSKTHRLSLRLAEEDTSQEWKLSQQQVMVDVLSARAQSCEHFQTSLLATGEETLAEATWNSFWGAGLPANLLRNTKQSFWPGSNNFGKALMEVRQQLRLASTEESFELENSITASDSGLDSPGSRSGELQAELSPLDKIKCKVRTQSKCIGKSSQVPRYKLLKRSFSKSGGRG